MMFQHQSQKFRTISALSDTNKNNVMECPSQQGILIFLCLAERQYAGAPDFEKTTKSKQTTCRTWLQASQFASLQKDLVVETLLVDGGFVLSPISFGSFFLKPACTNHSLQQRAGST